MNEDVNGPAFDRGVAVAVVEGAGGVREGAPELGMIHGVGRVQLGVDRVQAGEVAAGHWPAGSRTRCRRAAAAQPRQCQVQQHAGVTIKPTGYRHKKKPAKAEDYVASAQQGHHQRSPAFDHSLMPERPATRHPYPRLRRGGHDQATVPSRGREDSFSTLRASRTYEDIAGLDSLTLEQLTFRCCRASSGDNFFACGDSRGSGRSGQREPGQRRSGSRAGAGAAAGAAGL